MQVCDIEVLYYEYNPPMILSIMELIKSQPYKIANWKSI